MLSAAASIASSSNQMGSSVSSRMQAKQGKFIVPKDKTLPADALVKIAMYLIEKDKSMILPLYQTCKLFKDRFSHAGRTAQVIQVFKNLCMKNVGSNVKLYVTRSDVTKEFLQNCIKSQLSEKIFDEKHYDMCMFGYSNVWIEFYEPIFIIFPFEASQLPHTKHEKYINARVIIKCERESSISHERHLYLHEKDKTKKLIKWLYFYFDKTMEPNSYVLLMKI
jgi:hypothetical protein